jgi:hypothetical protein
MLIEKSDPTTVYCFKLVNGDEVVARIVESDDSSYTITSPATVMPSNQGIALMQSLFSMKDGEKIRLSRNHVMMFCEVDPRMRDHYIKTVTGIQTVTKDKIII